MSVMPFRHLSPSSTAGIREEAERMARLRESELVAVRLSEPLHP